MANIPHKFTQEAQDERGMKKTLENPKSRWRWGVGVCLKECANRGKKCTSCVAIAGKYTNFKPIETKSK